MLRHTARRGLQRPALDGDGCAIHSDVSVPKQSFKCSSPGSGFGQSNGIMALGFVVTSSGKGRVSKLSLIISGAFERVAKSQATRLIVICTHAVFDTDFSYP